MLLPSSRPARSAVESWAFYGDANGDELGHMVRSAGDLVPSEAGEEAYADIVVGAPGDSLSLDNEGVVYVFQGGPQGLPKDPYWQVGSGQGGSRFGAAVDSAGDVNNDGYDDLVIGAWHYRGDPMDPGKAQEGAVTLYCGPLNPLSPSVDWQFLGGRKESYAGRSVAMAGDVNNDGYDDILVGARWFEDPDFVGGAALLFYGGDTCDLGDEPDWVYEGDQAGANLGTAVATAGDVNGDGIADVIISAPGYDGDAGIDEGAVLVFYGQDNSTLASTPDWSAYGGQAEAWFGSSVGTAGDVNGDGWDDIVVGASRYDDRYANEGAAFVFYGGGTGLHADGPDWVAYGRQLGAWFGASVSTAGDADGDGWDDVLVGAPYYNKNGEGAAFIFYGSAEGLAKVPGWRATGEKAETEFGYSVSAAGDVRGDGTGGILVGAPVYKRDDKTPLGKAAAFYGPLLPSPYYRVYLPVIQQQSP